jgi:hypothetical protein
MNGKNGTVVKAALAVVVAVVIATSGLVFNNTYMGMRADVDHNTELIAGKANTDLVELKFDGIMREIQLLREELKEHDGR